MFWGGVIEIYGQTVEHWYRWFPFVDLQMMMQTRPRAKDDRNTKEKAGLKTTVYDFSDMSKSVTDIMPA